MAANIEILYCDGRVLKRLAGAGLAWLEHNQEKVNQLNVFPVPDGDTGLNMFLTLRKAYDQITPMNDKHVGRVSAAFAEGALLGARGNSGTILSQLWRGFAEALDGHRAFDGPLFAAAITKAVERAYGAVVAPVEGTILTVARNAAEEVNAHAGQEPNLYALLDVMVSAAHASLLQTPEFLPVLKKAGVVDSGGAGLVFMLEGMLKLLRGEEVYAPAAAVDAAHQTGHWQKALEPDDEEGYGYDVQFLMRGESMDVNAVRAKIDAMGWSTLVVGSDNLIKVHVHVHDPGQPISYAISTGAALDDVVVENMQLQYHHYVEERAAREALVTHSDRFVESDVVVITVASGPGFRRLFSEDLESARVIDGGQTMNPSTEDFLNAIDSLPNSCIVLLPNNKNIYMAAQQAATLAADRGKRVKVVPSRTLPQGVSAMFAYNNLPRSGDVDEIAAAMTDAMPNVVTLEVTTATRTVELDDIAIVEGQLIGLLDDRIVTVGEGMNEIVRDLLHKAFANQRELVTIYYGCDVDEAHAEALVEILVETFDVPEFEIVGGGQTLYPYIISVE